MNQRDRNMWCLSMLPIILKSLRNPAAVKSSQRLYWQKRILFRRSLCSIAQSKVDFCRDFTACSWHWISLLVYLVSTLFFGWILVAVNGRRHGCVRPNVWTFQRLKEIKHFLAHGNLPRSLNLQFHSAVRHILTCSSTLIPSCCETWGIRTSNSRSSFEPHISKESLTLLSSLTTSDGKGTEKRVQWQFHIFLKMELRTPNTTRYSWASDRSSSFFGFSSGESNPRANSLTSWYVKLWQTLQANDSLGFFSRKEIFLVPLTQMPSFFTFSAMGIHNLIISSTNSFMMSSEMHLLWYSSPVPSIAISAWSVALHIPFLGENWRVLVKGVLSLGIMFKNSGTKSLSMVRPPSCDNCMWGGSFSWRWSQTRWCLEMVWTCRWLSFETRVPELQLCQIWRLHNLLAITHFNLPGWQTVAFYSIFMSSG